RLAADDRSAQVPALRGVPLLRRRARHAAAAGAHRLARSHRRAARLHRGHRRRALPRAQPAADDGVVAGRRSDRLRHLLRRLPRPRRQRPLAGRRAHGAAPATAARRHARAPVPRRPHLPGRDPRLRPHARLRPRAHHQGSLGRRRLRARAAAQPGGAARRAAARRPRRRRTGPGAHAMSSDDAALIVETGGKPDERPFDGGGRAIVVALAIAALGGAGFVVALVLDPTQALSSYLIAYSFAITVVVGLLAFVMGAHAMNAAWPTAVRRVAELGFGAMPLLVVLYLPLFWSARLYPWAHPERVADHHVRELVLHKRPVMNAPFFFVRAIVFLLLWTLVAELLRRWSLAMDRPGAPSLKDRLRGFSCVLLPLVGITATFASFDWIMSLSPDFYSTMYGLYVLSGGF